MLTDGNWWGFSSRIGLRGASGLGAFRAPLLGSVWTSDGREIFRGTGPAVGAVVYDTPGMMLLRVGILPSVLRVDWDARSLDPVLIGGTSMASAPPQLLPDSMQTLAYTLIPGSPVDEEIRIRVRLQGSWQTEGVLSEMTGTPRALRSRLKEVLLASVQDRDVAGATLTVHVEKQ